MRLGIAAKGYVMSPHLIVAGWNADRPPDPAKPPGGKRYERLTALGPRIDWWDGWRWWTLESNGTTQNLPRCISANQALPWREVPE